MAGLNLLPAIVIYWNTAHLGEAIRQRKHAGLTVEPELWPTSHPLGGPTSCSPANTGGQSADNGLSVRFCPLSESIRTSVPRQPSATIAELRQYDDTMLRLVPDLPSATIQPGPLAMKLRLRLAPDLPSATMPVGELQARRCWVAVSPRSPIGYNGGRQWPYTALVAVSPRSPIGYNNRSRGCRRVRLRLRLAPDLPSATISQGQAVLHVLRLAPDLPSATMPLVYFRGSAVLRLAPDLPSAIMGSMV